MPTLRYTPLIAPGFNLDASTRLLDDCDHKKLWTGTTGLAMAARLKKALDEGADPNVQDRTQHNFGSALSKAVSWGMHPEAVQVLLEAGAEPLWGPEREIDNRLLTGDKDSSYQGWPVDPLNAALNALAWLVAANANAQQPEDLAKLESHLAVVDALLDAGADPHAQDPATLRSCMENFLIVVSENRKDPVPEVIHPLLPRLWRMLSQGQLATRRQRFALHGNWDLADIGWHRVSDVETINNGLQAYGRALLLDQSLPDTTPTLRPPRL